MRQIVNMMIEAYIRVMGEKKWDSMSEQEQHDVIMAMVRDSLKAIEKLEK